MPFPNINPIALEIGPLVIRWYALAYLGGVLLGAAYGMSILRRKSLWANNAPPFEAGAIWDFAFWAVLGIVIGGRIGYVLFYNFSLYAAHPLDALKLWDGGMSFHGGLVGIMIAMILFTRSKGGNILSSLDLLACVGPIGLFLGRVANFINGELYGRETTLPWGVIFPTGGPLPRHPSQLYEGLLEGLILFLILRFVTHVLYGLRRPGLAAGIFGVWYALSRILVELVRIPDPQLGYLFDGWITMGQILSVPVALAGLALIAYAMRVSPVPDATPDLGQLIDMQLRQNGPMSIASFMGLALTHPRHGYYKQGGAIGAAGDFITSPEVSQMFGELIGFFFVNLWQQMDQPKAFTLLELGPGRGTLMADLLRVAGHAPGFAEAVNIELFETDPELLAQQRMRLEPHHPHWIQNFDLAADTPLLVVANEFFDALPIRQFVRGPDGWHERMVGLAGDKRVFGLSPTPIPAAALPERVRDASEGAVYEAGLAASEVMKRLAAAVSRRGGAILAIDYGYAETQAGETLQAVRRHAYADPLELPGETDLSAHVDFGALAETARAAGLATAPLATQGDFLKHLGILARTAALIKANPPLTGDLNAALDRLVSPGQMGTLFKVFCAHSPGLAPQGFSS